jgi:hypothetical protein
MVNRHRFSDTLQTQLAETIRAGLSLKHNISLVANQNLAITSVG